MKPIRAYLCWTVLAGAALLAATGCTTGKRQAVTLIGDDPAPLTCRQALSMEIRQIPEDDLVRLLANTYHGGAAQTCWQPLMAKALEGDRSLPERQLVRGLKAFNRNETRDLFVRAAYQYFSLIARGDGTYGEPQKQLMTRYLSLVIREADSRTDPELKQAMLVCERLDPGMYHKFFN